MESWKAVLSTQLLGIPCVSKNFAVAVCPEIAVCDLGALWNLLWEYLKKLLILDPYNS